MDHATNDASAPLSHAATDAHISDIHSNETLSKVIAYASPYLFWTTVVGLSTGLLLMR